MKPLECSVERVEGVFGECTLTRNITEVKECAESLCDVDRYITFECTDKDLVGLVCEAVTADCSYLH